MCYIEVNSIKLMFLKILCNIFIANLVDGRFVAKFQLVKSGYGLTTTFVQSYARQRRAVRQR